MNNEHPKFRAPLQPSRDWQIGAQQRIDAQRDLIATIEPGSDAHRAAVQILLLLQDSLHVLSETDDLLAALRKDGKLR